MPTQIESLESRTLFSATALAVAIRTYRTDSATFKRDIVALSHVGRGQRTIVADLRRLHVLGADHALVRTLSRDLKAADKTLTKDAALGAKQLNRDLNRFINLDKLAAKHPHSTKIQSKFTAGENQLVTTLNNVATADNNNTNAVVNAADTDLNAIGAANSSDAQLQTDISNLESSFVTAQSNLSASGSSVFNTDINAIAAALPA